MLATFAPRDMAAGMSDSIAKSELFSQLGYGGAYDLLEGALEEAGLSRASRSNIAATKAGAVHDALAARFVIVCSRGDCQSMVDTVAGGRTALPPASQDDCAVCGGSSNARAVDDMVEAMLQAGLKKLCIVGGSPKIRVELDRLVAKRLQLRFVDGAVARTVHQAQSDLAWADRVVLWGGTILAHKVSGLYKGRNVIQLAKRGIQELAREVARSMAR
jgi:hypothetical protein